MRGMRITAAKCPGLFGATMWFGLMLSSSTAQQTTIPTLKSQLDRRVVITVDDLPGAVAGSDSANGKISDLRAYNHKIIAVLRAHHAPALGMVIGVKMEVDRERDARFAILEDWAEAGFDLGNHTYSHLHFHDMTLDRFEDDTLRGDVVSRAVATQNGHTFRYFRHPGFSEAPTPMIERDFEEFLHSRSYEIAPVTIEDADYQFNDVLDDARSGKDDRVAAATKALYLDHALAMFEYVESQSMQRFGREIPQVLLIHDNQINAEMLNTLLTDLEHRGYRFISLDDALSDPVYGQKDQPGATFGPCHYMCWGPPRGPRVPGWISSKFQEIRKANGN